MTEITQQYKVTTFEEGFTDKEIAIRRNIENILPENLRHYRTEQELESLKEYRKTADTFHPKNHFYAFTEDEMVGFIHLWPQYNGDNIGIQATISIPFVKPGHEDAEDILYETMYNQAKEYGIEQIIIESRSNNSVVMNFVDKMNFMESGMSRLVSHIPITKIKIANTHKEVSNFKRDIHGEGVLDLYESLGYDRSRLEGQFDMMEGFGHRVLSWVVVEEDNEIVAHGVAFKNEGNEKQAQANAVTMKPDQENKETIIKSVFQSHVEKLLENGIEEIELNLLEKVISHRKYYEALGFKFDEIIKYSKSI